MTKLGAKLFGKKQVQENATYALPPRPKYDFVEQYTLIDPKKVLNGGYGLFAACRTVPVICEESKVSSMGFRQCFQLPTDIVLGLLQALEQVPAEKIADPKMRTLSIVHLSKTQRVVIGPNLDKPKCPIFWTIDSDEHKGDWVLHVTPEKNRAIVEQLKIHTR